MPAHRPYPTLWETPIQRGSVDMGTEVRGWVYPTIPDSQGFYTRRPYPEPYTRLLFSSLLELPTVGGYPASCCARTNYYVLDSLGAESGI